MNEITVSEKELDCIKQAELSALIEFDRICKKYNLKYSLIYGTLLGAIRHKGFIPWDDDIDVCMLRADYEKFREIVSDEISEGFFYQSHKTDPEYYHLFDKIRVDETIYKENYLAKHNIHHGVYIDIFPFDNIPDSIWKQKLQLLHYQFYRVGLMVRYLDVGYRKGLKKVLSSLLAMLYKPFSLDYLYNSAENIAQKYNHKTCKNVFIFADSIGCNSTCSIKSFDHILSIPFETIEASAIGNYEEYLSNQYGNYTELPPPEERFPKHHLVELKIGEIHKKGE